MSYLNKTVYFRLPKGSTGMGKIIGEMADDGYLVEVLIPKSQKGFHIEIDDKDIVMIARSSKSTKPKTKRCRCKK